MTDYPISAHGISIRIPGRWDGRIFRRDQRGPLTARPAPGEQPASAATLGPAAPAGGHTYPMLHIANFALPEGLGDYASEACESMRPGELVLCLLEEGPESARAPLFRREGVPTLRARHFDRWRMHRPLPGMAGTQQFFHKGDRAFVLYVAVGSEARLPTVLPQINAVLASLHID